MKAESKIQQEIVIWFREQFVYGKNNPDHAIFSVPNEGKNVREQSAKISTGLMSGVSDLIVVMPGLVLFVEVKDATGRQEPKQIVFEGIVSRAGFEYHLVRTKQEFQEIINNITL